MPGRVPVSERTQALPFPTASWPRRTIALVVDWFACVLVVSLFTPVYGDDDGYGSLLVLALYGVEAAVFTTLAGGSFGQLATRLRVVRETGDPRPLGPVRSILRSVLVALVFPPLVFKPDGRGLHDMAANSATVTLETFRSLVGR